MLRARNASGFILVYTLLSIAIALGIISLALNRSTIFSGMNQVLIMQTKARQLALGGIALAMSELTVEEKKEKEHGRGKCQSSPQGFSGHSRSFLHKTQRARFSGP